MTSRDPQWPYVVQRAATSFGLLPARGCRWPLQVLLCITVIGIVVAIPYMPFMWWKKGATLGQKAMGIKVVRAADGGPIDGMSAFVRFAIFILESLGSYILIGLLGFIWAAFDKRKRAWHDLAAATVVIYGR